MLSHAQAVAWWLLTHNVFLADGNREQGTERDSKELGKEYVNSFREGMRRGKTVKKFFLLVFEF